MAPRLQDTPTIALHYFYEHAFGGNDDDVKEIRMRRAMIVNRAYLNSLFTSVDNSLEMWVNYRYGENDFDMMLHNYRHEGLYFRRLLPMHSFLRLIRIAHVPTLRIVIDSLSDLDAETIPPFIALGKMLRGKKELNKLDVHFNYHDFRLLSDFLDAKITKLTLCQYRADTVHLYTPNYALDFLYICVRNQVADYSSILRIRAHTIEVERNACFSPHVTDTTGFYELHDGPFLFQNEHLKKLIIDVCFDLPRYNDYFEPKSVAWSEYFLPKYEQAFRNLKAISSDIEVEAQGYAEANAGAKSMHDLVIAHESLIHNTHAYIDLAERIGVKVSFSQKDALWTSVRIQKENFPDNFREQLAARFGMRVEKTSIPSGEDSLIGDFSYKGHAFELRHEYWSRDDTTTGVD